MENAMTLEQAVNGVEAFMTTRAKAIAEGQEAAGLVKHYAAKKHSGSAGAYLADCVAKGLVLDAMAATLLFHSLANHSAWRQKFTPDIFPAAEKKAAAVGGTPEEQAKAKLSKFEKMYKGMEDFS